MYLADLRRLAGLFGGVPDKALACAFIAGLPDSVRSQLRAAARLDTLTLSQVLGRARAVLVDDGIMGAAAAIGEYSSPPQQQVSKPQFGGLGPRNLNLRCFICNDSSHLAKGCPKKVMRCFNCKKTDHLIAVSGKPGGGGAKSASALLKRVDGALPMSEIKVNGVMRRILVDSGCSCCIAHVSVCKSWVPSHVNITTISGHLYTCLGVGRAELEVLGAKAVVDVIVVNDKLLGCEFILGINGIKAVGGVKILSSGNLEFLGNNVSVAVGAAIPVTQGINRIDERDFSAEFDEKSRQWVARWKWAEPPDMKKRIAQYRVRNEIKSQFETEVTEWIQKGWLKAYDGLLYGPVKGVVPLMAVEQKNKTKVRPVFDFTELNLFVDAYSANADVCAEKLRVWRRFGGDVAVLDLKRAYMQVMVDKELWPYQTVTFRGQRYCLTRLGFGLNVSPLIMSRILNCVLSMDAEVKENTSAYIDDVYVNTGKVSLERVIALLRKYGLECKPPEVVRNGARVLGLRVWGESDGVLRWCRDNKWTGPEKFTRRGIFSFCGQIIGHLPVGGWLRPAVSFIKRQINRETVGWDDEVGLESPIRKIVADVMNRMQSDDPAKGLWCVNGSEVNVWVDASSLATGVVLEVNGYVVEDGSWLRESESVHINMAELNAIIKGVNLALAWGFKTLHVKTDSASVYNWVGNTLSGKSRVRTKAMNEMLVRRRLDIIRSLVEEYSLEVDIELVKSGCNRSDALTRVPRAWLELTKNIVVAAVGSVVDDDLRGETIEKVHRSCGHPGIDRTLYFVKKVDDSIGRAEVRNVVKNCEECCSIDPAAQHWDRGKLEVSENWRRVAINVTHYLGKPFLSIVDCGPSRFAIWRPLKFEDTKSVVAHLQNVFWERSGPQELLLDNATIFHSKLFSEFCESWGVRLRFRCAHVASGNAIGQ